MGFGRHPGPVILDRHHGFVRAVEVPVDIRLAAAVSRDVLEHRIEDRLQRDAIGRDDEGIGAVRAEVVAVRDAAPMDGRSACGREVDRGPVQLELAAVGPSQLEEPLGETRQVVDL